MQLEARLALRLTAQIQHHTGDHERGAHSDGDVGYNRCVSGLGEVVGNPVHATGVGLLLWGSQIEHPRRPVVPTGKVGTWVSKVRNWYRGEF